MSKITVKAMDNVKPVKPKQASLFDTVREYLRNIENFFKAVSLLVVSGVAFWCAYTQGFSLEYAREAVILCALYIGLTGAQLFFNHINHKG